MWNTWFWTCESLRIIMINSIVDTLWSTSFHILPTESAGASLYLLLWSEKMVECQFSTSKSAARILDKYGEYGQIDLCSHDIVNVRLTGSLVNACAFLPFSASSCYRAPPAFLRRAEKLPFSPLSASFIFSTPFNFQLFADLCCFLIFLHFSARKDGSDLKRKK